MRRRWGQSLVMVMLGLLLGGLQLVTGSVGWGVALLVFFLVVAVVVSPRAFPRSVSDAEARTLGRPIVYWRPGCPFCMRLRASLGRDARRLTWVDIWSDPQGAASVRAVANGNETVPTVVAAGEAMVNPDPRRVRELARTLL